MWVIGEGPIEGEISHCAQPKAQKAVASGELSKMIEPWDPWRLKPSAQTISFGQDRVRLVQPLIKQKPSRSPEDDSGSNLINEIPPGPETLLSPC
ncbi:hypothetical protein Ancab_033196 [Ancistrocladus abbreviatus]